MGVSYITAETIAACMDSFIGKPLILKRVSKKPMGQGQLGHEKVTERDVENKARGYISGWFRDGPWFCVEGIVFDDEAKDAIATVGYCSCGYTPTAVDKGGEHHAIRYDETITAFSGEHLAIVDRPRYEGATIRLNSKQPTAKGHMHIAFWKKSAPSVATGAQPGATPAAAAAPAVTNAAPAAAADPKTNSVATPELNPETAFEIEGENGATETVTLGELLQLRANAKANAGADIDDEDEVDVGNGRKAKMNALIAAYNAANPVAKTNAIEPAPAPVAKPNHFRVLLNARERSNDPVAAAGLPLAGSVDSLNDRIARGQKLFGTAPAGKN